MNIERMRELADKISQRVIIIDGEEIEFSMGVFKSKSNCGTAACAAGLACALWRPDVWAKGDDEAIFHAARAELGLDERLAAHLFYGLFSFHSDIDKITHTDVIEKILKMIEYDQSS